MEKDRLQSQLEFRQKTKKEREEIYGFTKIHEIIEEKEEAFQHQVELDRAEWEGMPVKPNS